MSQSAKPMHTYIDESWRPILAYNGLSDFEALWRLEAEWFEPPNRRRGGWSGVARCELTLPEGGHCSIFLKRQENHGTFSWRNPVKGVPTFLREFRRIQHYRACGIPTLEPVYFAMQRSKAGHRAILITEELTGYASMEDRVQRWLADGAPARPIRRRYMQSIAALLRNMHDHGIQHNCFFPKHIFVRMKPDGNVESRVIDLEKSRWRPHAFLCARRDLYSLNNHSQCWSRSDRLWFYKAYLQINRLTPFAKWLWRHIAAHSARKDRVKPSPRRLATKAGVVE